MSNVVSVDQFEKAINKYLNEYHEDINEDVRNVAKTITNEAKAELISKSPKSDHDVILKGGEVHTAGSYARGWTISTQTSKNVHTKKIWNKTDYRLTHLLEFGHATRNGGRAKAIPHVRPTEEKYLKKFEKELEKEITK